MAYSGSETQLSPFKLYYLPQSAYNSLVQGTSVAGYSLEADALYLTDVESETSYLPLAGGTMNAGSQIKRAGKSCSWYNGRDNALIRQNTYTGYNPVFSCKTTNGSWELGPYTSDVLYFVYNTDTGYSSGANTSGQYYNTIKLMPTGVLYGAAWNDYAEYRISDCQEPGRVICENGDDTLSIANERMQPGANIISDTFGFAIGETELAKTPIAVSGRVLAYPYEDRETFAPGDAVCAAPNGTVSKMTREEIREYPERIIGTVSAIPNYEYWGTGQIPVNGRIWIKVR